MHSRMGGLAHRVIHSEPKNVLVIGQDQHSLVIVRKQARREAKEWYMGEWYPRLQNSTAVFVILDYG